MSVTFTDLRADEPNTGDEFDTANPSRCGGCDIRITARNEGHLTTVATVYDSPELTAYIVHCVNTHAALVEVLENMLASFVSHFPNGQEVEQARAALSLERKTP